MLVHWVKVIWAKDGGSGTPWGPTISTSLNATRPNRMFSFFLSLSLFLWGNKSALARELTTHCESYPGPWSGLAGEEVRGGGGHLRTLTPRPPPGPSCTHRHTFQKCFELEEIMFSSIGKIAPPKSMGKRLQNELWARPVASKLSERWPLSFFHCRETENGQKRYFSAFLQFLTSGRFWKGGGFCCYNFFKPELWLLKVQIC